MIPRVRVNYTFGQLLSAVFSSEKSFKYRKELKEEIARYFDTNGVLLTSSGRAGIYQVLCALSQKKVVVPAYTCMVVIEAAMLAKKEVLFAPTSRETFNMSSLPKIDADCIVIATHQYGIACDIDAISDACRKAGAVLVEDCAASLGSRVHGKLTGTFGDYAVFSFDSSKLVTVPSKGGFIIAKDPSELPRIEGSVPLLPCSVRYKLKHLCRGMIYLMLKNKWIYRCFHYLTMQRKGQMQLDDHGHLDLNLGEFYTHGFYEWQASIALPQFRALEQIIQKRQRIYKLYDDKISNPLINKPLYSNDNACIRYAIQVKNKKSFYEKCLSLGLDMGFSFNHIASPDDFVEEHNIAAEVLNVPYYYNLSEKETRHVVEVINKIK